jgi:hypothetical protein
MNMIEEIVKSLDHWRLILEWGTKEINIDEIKGKPVFIKEEVPQLHYSRIFTEGKRIEKEHPIIYHMASCCYIIAHPKKYYKSLKYAISLLL